MKIGLGTVQFGLDYGISNREGRTSPDEVVRIIEVAKQYSIAVIDTAALYGTSEEVLGYALPQGNDFKLVTKTIRLDSNRITASEIGQLERAFSASLKKLRTHSIYGLMLHNPDDLLAQGGEVLFECLRFQQESGRVKKIGVSVYTGDQIDRILDRFEIDLVQLPINVLDQRLLSGGHLALLKSRGVEIHARSAFLQGLLLMDPETLPFYFDRAKKLLKDYHKFLQSNGITPVQAALGFLAGRNEIDVVICGVNNHRQLIELCKSTQPLTGVDFTPFALEDPNILNPSLWRTA